MAGEGERMGKRGRGRKRGGGEKGRDGSGKVTRGDGRERRKGREREERGYSPQTSIPGADTGCRGSNTPLHMLHKCVVQFVR